jgi:hypothetical protein
MPQILRHFKEENEGRHKSKDGQIIRRESVARQGRALWFLETPLYER